MKKWILTLVLLLASVTAANAAWIQCTTIRIIPGFVIQNCESPHRPAYFNYYQGRYDWRGYKHGYRHDIHAWNNSRYDRYYDRKKDFHRDGDNHGRYVPRYNNRW